MWSSQGVDALRPSPLGAPCSLVLETSSSPGLAVALLPLHQDRMLVSALLPPLPPSFPALLHLCLYLSLLLKMLSPSPVPQGSTWWRNKGGGNGGKRWK